ncbi:MAG: hypothetical protein A2413_12265 [Treponema sp. RIFOXYC1_FULL_61_9]|nr:MAG: hypothetical protein A2413_12265 [Treponema sp. RIFOXYC1_FULL_61_9]
MLYFARCPKRIHRQHTQFRVSFSIVGEDAYAGDRIARTSIAFIIFLIDRQCPFGTIGRPFSKKSQRLDFELKILFLFSHMLSSFQSGIYSLYFPDS